MREFIDMINEIRAKVAGGAINNKISVRFHVVDPLLRYLGWTDPEHLDLEQGLENGVDRPDYILKSGEKKIVMVTKKPSFQLEKATDQGFQYAHRYGARYLVLTNGEVWEIYDTTLEKPSKDKVINRCNIRDDDTIKICMTLITLLRSESVHESPGYRYQQPIVQQPSAQQPEPPPKQNIMPPDYTGLADWKFKSGTKLAHMWFPDGTTRKITKWIDWHAKIIEWLIDNKHITMHDGTIRTKGGAVLLSANLKDYKNKSKVIKEVRKHYFDGRRSAHGHRTDVIGIITFIRKKGIGITPNSFGLKTPTQLSNVDDQANSTLTV